MYGHTFINNFTGAPFKIAPPEGPENGIKHILVEGYIDKRLDRRELDSNFFNVSIAGVEDFIYRNMVDGRPGTVLDKYLLKKGGAGTEFSVPRIYSTLRARLQADIDAYYAKKADYDRRYDEKIRVANACKPLDFRCSATDGSNQWSGGKGSLGPMILAKSCSTYKQVFMQQVGEVPCHKDLCETPSRAPIQ